jgi:polyferredoxin
MQQHVLVEKCEALFALAKQNGVYKRMNDIQDPRLQNTIEAWAHLENDYVVCAMKIYWRSHHPCVEAGGVRRMLEITSKSRLMVCIAVQEGQITRNRFTTQGRYLRTDVTPADTWRIDTGELPEELPEVH